LADAPPGTSGAAAHAPIAHPVNRLHAFLTHRRNEPGNGGVALIRDLVTREDTEGAPKLEQRSFLIETLGFALRSMNRAGLTLRPARLELGKVIQSEAILLRAARSG